MKHERLIVIGFCWLLLTLAWLCSMIEITTLVSYRNCFTAGELFAWVTANGYEVNDIVGYCLRYVWPYWTICSLIYIGLCWGVWRGMRSEKRGIRITTYIVSICLLIPFAAPFVPHNLLAEVLCVRHQIKMIEKHKGDNAYFIYNAYPADTIATKQVYVLSIGESLRYENISLNEEYERKTMPLLAKQGNLCLYTNYYANATLTQHALPLLLCGVEAEDFTEHYSRKTIAKAMSEAGYRTALISHKAQLMNNDYHNYLAADFDTVVMVAHDSLITPALETLLKKEERLFVVTHYLGNHMFYTNRKEEDLIWRPDYNADRNVESDSLFLNAYDNSIRYTDKMLSRELEVLKKQEGVCGWMFVSDHGEYISERVSGHGHTYNPTKNEYHVPLIVWTNEQYRETYPTKSENVQRHKDEAVCADHVFWSVLDMAGVKIDEELQQDGMSIFGDTLLPHTRNLLLPNGRSIIDLN